MISDDHPTWGNWIMYVNEDGTHNKYGAEHTTENNKGITLKDFVLTSYRLLNNKPVLFSNETSYNCSNYNIKYDLISFNDKEITIRVIQKHYY